MPMAKHLFAVNELVKVSPRAAGIALASLPDSSFKIIRPLPSFASALQYLVRDTFSGQEWVISENEIRAGRDG